MKNLPPCETCPPPPREHLGYLEEYYDSQTMSAFGSYLGSRVVQDAPQPLGTAGRQIITLSAPLELKRTFTRNVTLPKGKTCLRVVFPLQGREIKQPLKLSNIMVSGSTTDLSGHANPEY